jgi:protein required for attachment to host cells
MPKRKLWVVVADGARARIFRANGETHRLEPVHEELYEPARMKGADLLADRPGRTFDRSRDQGRHAMEPDTDPKRVEKEKFAFRLADLLEDALNRDQYAELVLAAAPRMLGDLRDTLSPRVRERIVAELDKDLTTLPQPELEERLRPVIWPALT